jgi:hypothetical protein
MITSQDSMDAPFKGWAGPRWLSVCPQGGASNLKQAREFGRAGLRKVQAPVGSLEYADGDGKRLRSAS